MKLNDQFLCGNRKARGVDAESAIRATPSSSMETTSEASNRLIEAGFRFDLFAEEDGQLRCRHCGDIANASEATVMTTVRFEGDSNPDDEEILLGIMPPCGHAGLFSAAYGPSIDIEESEVLQHLCTNPAINLSEDNAPSASDYFFTALDTEELDKAMGADMVDLRSRRSPNHPVFNAIDVDIAQNWATW